MIKQKFKIQKMMVITLIISLLLSITFQTSIKANEMYDYTYAGAIKYGEKINEAQTALMKVKDKNNKEYEVYCIDKNSVVKENSKYTINNIEDQTYYSTESANKIRNILLNSYPYIALDKIKLLTKIYNLTEAQAITATQAAIWHYSNDINENNLSENVKKLYDYYLSLEAKSIEDAKISDIEIKQETHIIDGKYEVIVSFKATQNNANGSKIDLKYTINDINTSAKIEELQNSNGYQVIKISNLQKSDQFSINIYGTQNLKNNAYFYSPYGGEDASQSLVGISEGDIKISKSKLIKIESIGYTLTLNKIDAISLKGIANANFEISQDKEFSNNVIKATTKTDGTVSIGGLETGIWYVKETKAPDGYIPNADPIEFYINEKDLQLDIKNSKFGKIEIMKKDENENPVKGAKFTLYKESIDDNNIVSKNLESDINGIIHIDNVYPDTYYLVETETPDDYILNSEPIKIDVEAYKTTTVTRINETKGYGILKICKKDAVTKEQIGETIIGIYSDSEYKNLLKEITTDKDEANEINDLRPGTYYIKEIKAKDGYLLDAAPKKVTLEKNKTTEVTFYNSKNYSTAGNYANVMLVGLVMVTSAGLVLITRNIINKKKTV